MNKTNFSRRVKGAALEYKLELLLCFGVVAVIGALIFAANVDEDEWRKFSAEHDCKKVAHIRGDVFNTIGFDSKGGATVGIGSTPSKTGWLCNDGVTYYR